MSEYIFKLPDLGEGTVEAEIAEWMVKMGDMVQEEDTICAMLTDKAAVELTAPVSGRVSFMAGYSTRDFRGYGLTEKGVAPSNFSGASCV